MVDEAPHSYKDSIEIFHSSRWGGRVSGLGLQQLSQARWVAEERAWGCPLEVKEGVALPTQASPGSASHSP